MTPTPQLPSGPGGGAVGRPAPREFYYDDPSRFAEAPESTGLPEYGRMIWRRKGTLILIAFSGMLAAILITLPQTPLYRARAAIEIQDANPDFLNTRQVRPVDDSYGRASDIQTPMKVLQSESLLRRVVDKLGQGRTVAASPQRDRVSAWRTALNLRQPDAGSEDGELDRIAKNIKVRTVGQTRLVEVLSESSDPQAAADFANALVNEFIDQNIEDRWKMSQRTEEWLSRQLGEMRIKLERSEESLQNYARKSGLMFTGEKTNVSEEKLRQLQAELSAAQAERIARQSRLELTKTAPTETLPEVTKDASLQDYQSKLTDLQRQRAEAATTLTDRHWKVKKIQAQINEMTAALRTKRAEILQRIRNEFDESKRREALLAADYATQSQLVTDQSAKSVQYNILKREVDSNRQLYDGMLQRLKEASIASAVRSSNIRIVDVAKRPRRPSSPNLMLNTALGLLLGGVMGVVFIVVRERLNRTVRAPGDSAVYLDLPELGVIPSFQAVRKWRSSPHEERRTGAADERVELITWQHKSSVMAESFRAVLTSILFSGENGGRPRVLALTSAGPAEGKSMVTSNLGVALAEVGQRVLLIDGDLRRPRLHRIFDLPNEQGLGTLLQNQGEEDGASEAGFDPALCERLICVTAVPKLYVLPAGPPTTAASNLLHAPQLPELLREMKQQFDMVLIDTPPMMVVPDGRVLGRLADATVLVMRSNRTTWETGLAMRQRLADDSTRVLGIILNAWDPKAESGSYQKYYRGYYKCYGQAAAQGRG